MKKFVILLIAAAFISCSNNKAPKNSADDRVSSAADLAEDTVEGVADPLSEEELKYIVNNFSDNNFKPTSHYYKEPKYTISRDYLKDPLDFKSLDYNQYPQSVGVICTTGVKMYKEHPGKRVLMDLPRGSVIEILEKIENPVSIFSADEESEETKGLFEFNKEYNFWYKVKYKEATGFVFGSYLIDTKTIDTYFGFKTLFEIAYVESRGNSKKMPVLKDSDKEKIIKLAYYYSKPVRSDAFYDFAGFAEIKPQYKGILPDKRFLCEKVDSGEYSLSVEKPDDMTSLYMDLHTNRAVTTFITIDYLIHNLHLLFDRTLENTEARAMYPLLKNLAHSYLLALDNLEQSADKNDKKYLDTIVMLKKYFGTALLLISPESAGVDLTQGESELDVIGATLKKYPEILSEVKLINEAAGRAISPVLGYNEDYTQFIPRSHYTKSERLKRYFRAMIYLGRMHLYCTLDPEHKEKTVKHTAASLLMTKIAKENKDIYATWNAIFDPITYLIGESDDYTLKDFIRVADGVDFKNFDKWVDSDDNVLGFIKTANEKIKPPKISGNSLYWNMKNPSELSSDTKIPAGFRLFGQRFTFDSYIHTMLSSPRVGDEVKGRNMVKSLDVMGVLGNKSADELLANEKSEIKGFADNYNLLRNQFDSFSDEDFSSTFYNGYLDAISEICKFNEEKPFYFTQNRAWDRKTLHSASASWAELRHDTLLYVKQNASEMAGKMPGPTWVIDPIDRPIGYVEPNLGALYAIKNMTNNIATMAGSFDIISDVYKAKFDEYLAILHKLTNIAEKESDDETVTNEENDYIYDLPYVMAHLILPPNANSIDRKDLQMALVADVHTDSLNNEALEVATGIPYRIYVALNDGIGGKRIGVGYVFSYYEFKVPSSERLDDDKWKDKVYGSDEKYIESKIPEWVDFIVK